MKNRQLCMEANDLITFKLGIKINWREDLCTVVAATAVALSQHEML